MLTEHLDILDMGLFGKGTDHFHLIEITGLLERFPVLENPHRQNFYTLIFIENAEGQINIDNEKIRLDAAKIIVIRPHCMTQIDINRHAKGKMVCFTADFFSLRYNHNILYDFEFLRVGAKAYIRLSAEALSRFMNLMALLEQDFPMTRSESKNVLRSYLNIILHDIQRLHYPLGTQKTKSLKHQKLLQFEQLIDQHYTKESLPSFYAQLLHISANYLNKICREENGSTAGEMIRDRISVEAQRLLHYTSCSVNEIANQLGFENGSYFVTFFRKKVGLTPEQFRKREC